MYQERGLPVLLCVFGPAFFPGFTPGLQLPVYRAEDEEEYSQDDYGGDGGDQEHQEVLR